MSETEIAQAQIPILSPPPSKPPKAKSQPKAKPTGPGFDEFWAVWPKKVSKGGARKAYAKAVKGNPSLGQTIIDAVNAQIAGENLSPDKDRQFIPLPSRWLNEERWEDEITPRAESKIVNGKRVIYESHDEEMRITYRKFADGSEEYDHGPDKGPKLTLMVNCHGIESLGDEGREMWDAGYRGHWNLYQDWLKSKKANESKGIVDGSRNGTSE